jgi:DNA-binding transcriptional ArsR family regulator/2-polyprenyl-3-methyl-5-hydroxy-6-metoxy-1,4-benzoquinol methylase
MRGAASRFSAGRLIDMLKAAGEPTRLRALALLARGELAVGELALALGQSQPRISRHLRLLVESGLVDRQPEGAWVFYRIGDAPAVRAWIGELIAALDPEDSALRRDEARLTEIRAAREAAASAYFAANAEDWARVSALHMPEADIESAMVAAAGPGPFELMVDVGAGAGRMLTLFAGRVRRAEGFDSSRQMLAIARAALAPLPEGRAHVRYGDVYDPPMARGSADLVTIHHVLHFLSDPARALMESAALLKVGGRMVVSDFAPHQFEFLRTHHQHRRLGFTDAEVVGWMHAAGIADVETTTLTGEGELRDRLTVKVWAGRRVAVPVRDKSGDPNA